MVSLFEPGHYFLNPWAFPIEGVGISLGLLGFGVMIRERASRVSILFCALTWSGMIWLLAYAGMYSTNVEAAAITLGRIGKTGVVFIPGLFYLFSLVVTRRLREHRALAASCLAVSALFAASVLFTPHFIAGTYHYRWGYYVKYGPLSYVFLVYFTLVMALSLQLFWVEYRQAHLDRQKKRLRAFVTAFAISCIGAVDFLPAYGIPIYPFGYLFVYVFVLIIARAIWHYHLIDITPAFAVEHIIENMTDALLVVDHDGVIRVANRQACHLFQRAHGRLVGLSVTAAEHPLFTAEPFDKVLEGKSLRSFEIVLPSRKTGVATYHVQASVLTDAEGEPMAVLYLARDITRRKQTEDLLTRVANDLSHSERELRNKTQILQSMLHSMSDGVLVVDKSGKFLLFNPAAEEMLGVGWLDVEPQDWVEKYGCYRADRQTLFHFEEFPSIRAARGEEVNDVEMYVCNSRRPQGRWVSFSARPLRDEWGDIRGSVAVFRDVTERKKAEEAIRAQDKRFRAVVEHAMDGIVSADSQGRIIFLNKSAERIFGYTQEESVGQPLTLLMPERYYAAHQQGFERFLTTGKSQVLGRTLELEGRRKDGREFPIELSLAYWETAEGVFFTAVMRDISVRRQAEETRQRLAAIVSSSDDAILRKTLDGTIIDWNPAAERMYGYSQEEVKGKSISILTPPGFENDTQIVLDKIKSGVVVKYYETKRRTKDGRVIDVSLTVSPIRDSGGAVIGAATISRDITQQKLLEEEVRKAANEISDLYNNAPCGYQSLDENGFFLRINDTELKWLGYSRQEMVGKMRFVDILQPQDVQRFEASFSHLKQHGTAKEREFTIYSKDGTPIDVLWSASAVYDPNGKFLMTRGVIYDITERRRTEEELREMSLALENAVEGIARVGTEGQFLMVNKTYADMMGRAPDSLIGGEWQEMVHPEDRDKVEYAYKKMMMVGKAEVECRGQRSDGNIFFQQIVLVKAHDRNHKFDGHYCFSKDISDRKRAEREIIRKTVELARSNAEREQLEMFAFIASHDLQEPLQKIVAFGDLLKERCGPTIDDKGKNYLERMENAAMRMSQLISDLLQYSRVTTKVEPFKPVDLSQLVREVLSDLEIRVTKTRAVVEVGDMPTIEGDRVQLRQLFQNLIANALKFHKPDETPHVTVRSQNLQDGFIEISVEDQGIGFDEQSAGRIFRPFERLHSRSQYEGSGMGLAICKKVVEHHSGSIIARSTPGSGSTFIVRLPVSLNSMQNEEWKGGSGGQSE